MSILSGAKVFADLCLLLCAASMANCWSGTVAAQLAPPLLCALGAALGCGEKRFPALRYPALVLPALCFLWPGDLPRLVVTAAAVVYTALVIVTGRGKPAYDSYWEYFGKGLFALGGCTLLSLLFGTWRSAALFALLHCFTGVYLLRQLRLGRAQSTLSQAVNLAAMAAVTAVGTALLGSLLALSKLRFILAWIWDKVANLLLAVIWVVTIGLGWLWDRLMALLALLGLQAPPARQENQGAAIIVQNSPYFEEVESDPTVFYLLLALALTALGVFLLRRAMAHTGAERRVARRQVEVERLERDPSLSRFSPGSPRDKVRQSYRRFLRLLQKQGAKLTEAQTTEEMHRAGQVPAEETAAGRLRSLYLTARYNDDASVTARDAREAKELLRELEKNS